MQSSITIPVSDAFEDSGQFEQGLRRILWELREYLNDIVVIGGWVPYLYRKYGGFAEWKSSLSRTAEVDVLLVSSLEPLGRKPISTILDEAGFRPAADARPVAVWLGEVQQGEQIEFLVPHKGTARQIGLLQPIETQQGLGAVSLPDLELLRDFTRTLSLPITVEGQPPSELEVRVPWLGAYLANKAATFPKRRLIGRTTLPENPKKAKDLLYMRDVMAAGEAIVRCIVEDCTAMRSVGKVVQSRIEYAANNLRLLRGGSFTTELEEAAEMLAERDATGQRESLADLRGYLDDALEVLGRS